jgi:hypothetical protein
MQRPNKQQQAHTAAGGSRGSITSTNCAATLLVYLHHLLLCDESASIWSKSAALLQQQLLGQTPAAIHMCPSRCQTKHSTFAQRQSQATKMLTKLARSFGTTACSQMQSAAAAAWPAACSTNQAHASQAYVMCVHAFADAQMYASLPISINAVTHAAPSMHCSMPISTQDKHTPPLSAPTPSSVLAGQQQQQQSRHSLLCEGNCCSWLLPENQPPRHSPWHNPRSPHKTRTQRYTQIKRLLYDELITIILWQGMTSADQTDQNWQAAQQLWLYHECRLSNMTHVKRVMPMQPCY